MAASAAFDMHNRWNGLTAENDAFIAMKAYPEAGRA
jgi:hypothetical protein